MINSKIQICYKSPQKWLKLYASALSVELRLRFTDAIFTKISICNLGKWLGNGADFTVVDTPGFGDTDNDDNELIDEMMSVLKDTIEGANALVLLVNGEDERSVDTLRKYPLLGYFFVVLVHTFACAQAMVCDFI